MRRGGTREDLQGDGDLDRRRNHHAEPGYVIVYNWDKATQPNDGYSDHIGFVEEVSGGNDYCY